jgi:hypothetical protein
MAGLGIYVDDRLIGNISIDNYESIPEVYNITLSPIVSGQRVKVKRDRTVPPDSKDENHHINICEVQVWVGKSLL